VDSVSGTNITTIHVGEVVEWQWASGPHSTTSGTCVSGFCTPDFKWDSQVHSAPFSYVPSPYPFGTSATYPYYCQIHGGSMGMIGTVVVNP
jgi:plastocyanin